MTFPDQDFITLSNAGISKELITYLQDLRRQRVLKNEDIIKMAAAKIPLEYIVKTIKEYKTDFNTKSRTLKKLVSKYNVPVGVMLVMKEAPLTYKDITALAEDKTAINDYLIVINTLGYDGKPLGVEDALSLTRSGVPLKVTARIREIAEKKRHGKTNNILQAGRKPAEIRLWKE